VKPPQENRSGTPEAEPNQQEQVEPWDVLAGLRNYASDHVLLIGKPGSGKSTSLERLLWEEAGNALNTPNAKIPVLVKLRRCTSIIEELIRDFLNRHQLPLDVAEIEKLLRQGKFLLLLDGLNELPESFRTHIANFRDRYRRSTPMIVSTRDFGGGGTLGIEKILKMLPLTEPQMREFVRGYLGEEGDRLFQQLKGDRLRKFAETPLLLWMLCRVFAHSGKVPDNLGLAFREFAQLHDQELQADAPADSRDQWHKLLRHLAFVMMQGKTLIDPELSIPREEAEDCLTVYLQQVGRSNPRDCAELWFKDLLKYHLIQPVIQPNLEEHIEFRHQLIQEYYAAEYLLRLLPDLSDEQLKRNYLNYLKWTEPIALMLALVDNEAQALRVVKLALAVDRRLGARLAGEVQPASQVETVGWLKESTMPELLKVELLGSTKSVEAIPGLLEAFKNSDSSVRWAAATALSHINEQESVQALWSASNDPAYFVRLASIAALGTIGNSAAIEALLKILENAVDDDAHLRSAYELGRLGNKIGIQRLSEALNHQESSVIRQAIAALKLLNTEASNSVLLEALKHRKIYVRTLAVQALGETRNDAWIPDLLKVMNHEDSRSHEIISLDESVVNALGRMGSDKAIAALLSIAECQNLLVRRQVLELLGNLNCKTVVPTLQKALKDEDVAIRRIAATSLGQIGNELAVPDLLQALDDDGYVCANAARALGQIGSIDAVPKLLQMLTNEDRHIRWSASDALGKIGGVETIAELLKLLRHPNFQTRWITAKTLGIIGDKATIPELMEALEEEERLIAAKTLELNDNGADVAELTEEIEASEEVIVDLAVALIRLDCCVGTLVLVQKLEHLTSHGLIWGYFSFDLFRDLEIEAAIPVLLKAVENQSKEIFSAAASVLERILRKTKNLSEKLFSIIRKTLVKADEFIYTIAISLLSKIDSKEVITEILKALDNPHLAVRLKAASALAELGNESAIPILLEALGNEEVVIRTNVASALVELGTETVVAAFLDLLSKENSKAQKEIIKALESISNPKALTKLQQLELNSPDYEIAKAIATIQENCKYYNYEICPDAIQNEKLEIKNGEQETAVGQTTTIFKIETLNAPHAALNLGGIIHGDQIGTQSHQPNP
jgi:HEAT repeat protein